MGGAIGKGVKPGPFSPNHWGLPLFLAGLIAAVLAALVPIPPFALEVTLSLLGVSAVLPFISFPRIPNFRLDTLILNAAVIGLILAKGWNLNLSPELLEPTLGLLLLLHLAAAPLLPVRVRAGTAPQILSGLLVLTGILIYSILGPSLVPWLQTNQGVIGVLTGLDVAAMSLGLLAALLTLFLMKTDYGLGGGVTGMAAFGLLLASGRGASFRPAIPGVFASILLGITLYVWVYRLRFRISYDPLMQIYNRAHADQILHSPPGENMGSMGAVAMVDLDHFKHLNDRHGHAVGDKVLYAAAQAIRKSVLPSGICCRYGGEEIIVFLPETSPEKAETIFESVRKNVEKLKLKDGRRAVHPTCSIGWSPVTGDMDKPTSYFVEKADKALYKAKEQGRNRVVPG